MVNLFCLCGGDGEVVELDSPTEESTTVEEAIDHDLLNIEDKSMYEHYKRRWITYADKTALVCVCCEELFEFL